MLYHILILPLIATYSFIQFGMCKEEYSQACDEAKYGYVCLFEDICGQAPMNYSYYGARSPYLMDGENVKEGEFPSFAQLRIRLDSTTVRHCSGVIISDYHIVTAGHCVRSAKSGIVNADRVYVSIGTVETLIRRKGYKSLKQAENICTHPDINGNHDMAVVTLKDRIHFDRNVQPACWTFKTSKIAMEGPEAACYQVGAGRIREPSPEIPKNEMTKPIVQKLRVERYTINRGDAIMTFIHPKPSVGSSCPGDSGGPTLCFDHLTRRWRVVAVLSSGYCSHGTWFYNSRLDSDLARLTSEECLPTTIN